jgi:hypothetical protein
VASHSHFELVTCASILRRRDKNPNPWHKNSSNRISQMQTWLQKIVSAVSVTPTCPRCKGVIPSEDVNVAKDIAFCRTCNLSHELSALTTGVEIDPDVDVSRPPPGTWFHRDGFGTVTGATHRSLGQALGLLLFAGFWNGIVSVFILFVIASILQHLGVPLPRWWPAMSSKGHLMSIPMTIFLCLFLTPFVAVGVGMIVAFLSSLGGRTELRVQGSEAVLFAGIGPVGFRKRFFLTDVKAVRIEDKRWRDSDGDSRRKTNIVIERNNEKPFRFGSMLTEERRKFLAGAVRKALNR